MTLESIFLFFSYSLIFDCAGPLFAARPKPGAAKPGAALPLSCGFSAASLLQTVGSSI